MKDITICIKLKKEEALVLSGMLALIATINAMPDSTVLCNRILKQLTDAMENGDAASPDLPR